MTVYCTVIQYSSVLLSYTPHHHHHHMFFMPLWRRSVVVSGVGLINEVNLHWARLKVKKVKERIAVNGTPSHSYGVSLAVWDHTALPSTLHK